MIDVVEARGVWDAYPLDDHRCLYISPDDPMDVLFFLHDSKDEEGYGGAVFELTRRSGRKIRIRGPWSSNSKSVFEITGIAVEPYTLDGEHTFHRLVGAVECDSHSPYCLNNHPEREGDFYAMGFCRKCGKGIFGLYTKEGWYVEGQQER